MKKQLYKMACVGVITGIMGSTVSVQMEKDAMMQIKPSYMKQDSLHKFRMDVLIR